MDAVEAVGVDFAVGVSGAEGVVCGEVPGAVAVADAGDADFFVGADGSGAGLVGEGDGFTLGVGGEEFV